MSCSETLGAVHGFTSCLRSHIFQAPTWRRERGGCNSYRYQLDYQYMHSAIESDVSDLLQADRASMCDHAPRRRARGTGRCTQTTEQNATFVPSHARHHNT